MNTNTSRWHGSPNHHWLWKLHTGLQATWILCLSTLPPDSGTLISKWNTKSTFIRKEDFGPQQSSYFTLSQVRCFWWCFCFCFCFVTLDALTPASVHFLWISPKCLNRLCLTVFSSLRSSLLLMHIFLTNFFLPVNFAFNMLWYSIPWTATPFSNDPLCERVSMIVFWTIAKSAVFSIIVVSKNKRYPECILYGWSFIETQM